eukprot:TRINITY_DN1022_c0_g1_i1.p1 TRINITY_DN1022_c0_g1~~TRINITY_DN1022_c0_g1_i1.p1  ORF type:complete len:1101 (+),score=353.70 TRINITY_DN1022_c0_g1_i1:405-3305(+)
MKFSSEWKKTVTRIGRWIDFENDYKTMDINFMESVWWVFSQLFEKGLVYRGFKVMPYSTGCTTPLSNFEANLNYKDVSDPAVTVNFPLTEDPTVKLLAWTTTPWTLPSNMALCVHPDLEYVKVKDKETGETYILMKERLSILYASAKPKSEEEQKKATEEGTEVELEYELLDSFPGSALVGKTYTPLFDYFAPEYKDRAWKVLSDTYVTSDSGTGIVHQAPAFGEDDYRVCLAAKVIEKTVLPCPVDADGNFTEEVTDFKGMFIKDADKPIIKMLKAKKRIVNVANIRHSYPFCWRSETPLIYRTIPSWFVNVEKIKDRLVANNKDPYWVPSFVKEKRFHNWLSDARDWAISRNRYWGTPLPIWSNEDGSEVIVIGSVEQLEKLTGEKVTDLHRHKIDHLKIPSQKNPDGPPLSRIPEVFDCWFESGSMPYAQQHYPFENKETFDANFPAQFIAEGLDQTRGWFYTLMVIGTALFDQSPFENLICNGLVLAADGKKMSKRLKNYPDPTLVIDNYGADSLRLYLINSPVVRAEPLKFREKGVSDVIKNVFLKWFNSYRFFAQNVESHGSFTPTPKLTVTNVMDRWILANLQSLLSFVKEEMAAYRLYTVVPKLVAFIEDFSNWYIRLNRGRIQAGEGETEEEKKTDNQQALDTVFNVLLTLSKAMAPFTPFFSETLYQNLRLLLPTEERENSVHFCDFPSADESLADVVIVRQVSRMQAVIELARKARDRGSMPVKQALSEVVVYQPSQEYLDDVLSLESYVLDELNVRKVVLKTESAASSVKKVVRPNNKVIGQLLGKNAGKVFGAVKKMTREQIDQFEETNEIELAGFKITNTDESQMLLVSQEYDGDTKKFQAGWNHEVLVLVNLVLTDELLMEGAVRELCNRIQRLRKEAGAQKDQALTAMYQLGAGKKQAFVLKALVDSAAEIEAQCNTKVAAFTEDPERKVIASAAGKKVSGIVVTFTLFE